MDMEIEDVNTETSEVSEDQQEESSTPEEEQPVKKPKVDRVDKIIRAKETLEKKVKQYESELGAVRGLRDFINNADEATQRALLNIVHGKLKPEEVLNAKKAGRTKIGDKLNQEEYEPWVVEMAKKVDSFDELQDKLEEVADQNRMLKEHLQQLMAERENQSKNSLDAHLEGIDAYYDTLLEKTGLSEDEGLSTLITRNVLVELTERLGDPKNATKQDVKEVFEEAVNTLMQYQTKTFKRKAGNPVPASGSKLGKAVSGRDISQLDDEERADHIANAFSHFFRG